MLESYTIKYLIIFFKPEQRNEKMAFYIIPVFYGSADPHAKV